MGKNIIKKFIGIWIILSLIFIIPLNIGIIFATSNNIATNSQVSSVCTGQANVKDSLLMSIVTMCLPGILEKVQQWREIKCETAVCYYDAVKNNLDPTFCLKQEQYNTCTYIVGEAFAIPGISVFDHLRQLMANALANPAGYILSYATKLGREYVNKDCSSGTCNTPSAIISVGLVIVDGSSLVQQIREIQKNGFFPPINQKSACDQLPAIKKEMDKILKYG